MNGYQWLASYPKSGNTWLRLALDSLLHDGAPPDFSRGIAFAPLAAARAPFDHLLDVDSSDLTADEIGALRPRFHDIEIRDATAPLPRKVHDAWTLTADGEPLFSPAVTLATICVVRDPRDIAPSLAAHLGIPIDAAIAFMARPAATLASGRRRDTSQLPQRLLTWSAHVESWLDAPGMPPPLLLRYEDMSDDAAAALLRAARHLGCPTDDRAAGRAVAATRFDALRTAEERHGFGERSGKAERFFRRGVAGGWRDTLSPAQAARIEDDHAGVMARLGYR